MVGLHFTLPSTTTNPTSLRTSDVANGNQAELYTCAASTAANDGQVEPRCFRASLLNRFEDATLCRSEDNAAAAGQLFDAALERTFALYILLHAHQVRAIIIHLAAALLLLRWLLRLMAAEAAAGEAL